MPSRSPGSRSRSAPLIRSPPPSSVSCWLPCGWHSRTHLMHGRLVQIRSSLLRPSRSIRWQMPGTVHAMLPVHCAMRSWQPMRTRMLIHHRSGNDRRDDATGLESQYAATGSNAALRIELNGDQLTFSFDSAGLDFARGAEMLGKRRIERAWTDHQQF